jgi:hypothetical protein
MEEKRVSIWLLSFSAPASKLTQGSHGNFSFPPLPCSPFTPVFTVCISVLIHRAQMVDGLLDDTTVNNRKWFERAK